MWGRDSRLTLPPTSRLAAVVPFFWKLKEVGQSSRLPSQTKIPLSTKVFLTSNRGSPKVNILQVRKFRAMFLWRVPQKWRKFPLNSRENCFHGPSWKRNKVSAKGGTPRQEHTCTCLFHRYYPITPSKPGRCLLSQQSVTTGSLHLMTFANLRGQQCYFLSVNSQMRDNPKLTFKTLPFPKS